MPFTKAAISFSRLVCSCYRRIEVLCLIANESIICSTYFSTARLNIDSLLNAKLTFLKSHSGFIKVPLMPPSIAESTLDLSVLNMLATLKDLH